MSGKIKLAALALALAALPAAWMLAPGLLPSAAKKTYRKPVTELAQVPQEQRPLPETLPVLPQEPPELVNWPVPFSSQAPHGIWDDFFKEACEEASISMAASYFSGVEEGLLDKQRAESLIRQAAEWEKTAFGYHRDINAQETARTLRELFGLGAEISTDVSLARLKIELAAGKLVLWPAQGQLLGNPNFRSPGPPYHMLLIRGYSPEGIITNDPGTRKGSGYLYDYQTLYLANGDWSHVAKAVDRANKVMIVVSGQK